MQTNEILGLPDLDNSKFSTTLDKLSKKVSAKKSELYKSKKKGFGRDGKGPTNTNGSAGTGQKTKSFKNHSIKEEGGESGRKRKAPPAPGTYVEKKSKVSDMDFGTTGEKPNWKELKAERKKLKESRKSKKNTEVYELSKEAKLMWEELRQEACPQEKRTKLSVSLYELIQPHIKKLVFSHDIVRVIECLVAVGGPSIRNKIFEELKEQLPLLIQSKYGHFYVIKILKYGTREHRATVIKAFEGNVVKLMKHSVAATVIEYAYNDHANSAQRTRLIQEFYGPEFRHFKDESLNNLGAVLAKNPEKREVVMRNLRDNLLKVVSKGPWRLTLVHTLLMEYMTHCDPESLSEFSDLLKNELVNILHTKDGSRVAMMCLWHGTPKDRKTIVKSFKTHVSKMAKEEHGCLVLMALFDCVDDTTLVSKAIIQELMEDCTDLMMHQHGRKVLIYLVTPRNTVYFHPQFCQILARGDDNKHSKKDMNIRRKELLDAVQDDLVACVARNFDSFINNNQIALALKAILNECDVPKLKSVFETIADCAFKLDPKDFVDKIAVFKLLKSLIQKDGVRKNGRLSDELLEDMGSDTVELWLTFHRGCSLILTMLETDIPNVQQKIVELLNKKCKTILAKQDTYGAKALLEKLKVIPT